eukprot:4367527-Pyramimonas_sp.AAC.1
MDHTKAPAAICFQETYSCRVATVPTDIARPSQELGLMYPFSRRARSNAGVVPGLTGTRLLKTDSGGGLGVIL